MTKLVNPITIFLDGRGFLLDGGYIYVGEAGTDPEIGANQIDIFFDKDMTIPAAQPLRTLGGVIVNGYNLGKVYFAEPDYSITVRDADAGLVYYEPTAFDTGGVSFQPLADDLTEIAALTTTAFGRGLLTAADAAALRTAAGLGSIAVMAKATAAQFRANVADKALTTDAVWGAAASVPLAEAAGAVAVDLNLGINFTLAMTGNWTLSTPTNGKDGQSGKVEITQDATGGRTLAYGAGWTFAGGVDPTLSTGANAKDVLEYQVMADGTVLGSLIKGRA